MMEQHPVQGPSTRGPYRVRSEVTLAAYEVYCEIFTKQEALVTGNCRGGFGVNELIAFLYARSFPRKEWKVRFCEAIEGMTGL